MDFPLIDDDEDEVASTPPLRPPRRTEKSPNRGEASLQETETTPKKLTNGQSALPVVASPEKSLESSPKQTPVKKTVSLPATPLTDPEKQQNSAAKKKLNLNVNRNNEDNNSNSLASPVDQISSTSNEIDSMDGILSSSDISNSNSPAKKSTGSNASQSKRTFMQTITGMFGRGTTPDSRSKSPDLKSTETERKSRSDSFLKFAKGFQTSMTSQ